jgi:hypothetical protein
MHTSWAILIAVCASSTDAIAVLATKAAATPHARGSNIRLMAIDLSDPTSGPYQDYHLSGRNILELANHSLP